jgi:hypothetical protein
MTVMNPMSCFRDAICQAAVISAEEDESRAAGDSEKAASEMVMF